MKNWNEQQWVRFLLAVTVFFFLSTYIIGMFIRNQPTDEANKDLRLRIIDLLAFITAQLLVDKSKKDDK